VKWQERFLYRAVDSSGQTIDSINCQARHRPPLNGSFKEEWHLGNSLPRVINVDQNRPYPAAVAELKKDGGYIAKIAVHSRRDQPCLIP
jgi:transposase-like protein